MRREVPNQSLGNEPLNRCAAGSAGAQPRTSGPALRPTTEPKKPKFPAARFGDLSGPGHIGSVTLGTQRKFSAGWRWPANAAPGSQRKGKKNCRQKDDAQSASFFCLQIFLPLTRIPNGKLMEQTIARRRGATLTPFHRATIRNILSPQIKRTFKRRNRRASAVCPLIPCIPISEFGMKRAASSAMQSGLRFQIVAPATRRPRNPVRRRKNCLTTRSSKFPLPAIFPLVELGSSP